MNQLPDQLYFNKPKRSSAQLCAANCCMVLTSLLRLLLEYLLAGMNQHDLAPNTRLTGAVCRMAHMMLSSATYCG